MPAVVSDRFRQLVVGLTDAKSFEALMAHIRSSNSEGFCPVCASVLVNDPATDYECRHGPACIHGKCTSCTHSSHYDPTREPDMAMLTDEIIRSTRATLDELVALLDAGYDVTLRSAGGITGTDRRP